MVQRSKDAAQMDAQTELSKKVCVLSMGQRSSNAA